MTDLSENALKILQRRYLRKDKSGTITETPDELFHRVASTVASAELFWGKQEDVVKRGKNFTG